MTGSAAGGAAGMPAGRAAGRASGKASGRASGTAGRASNRISTVNLMCSSLGGGAQVSERRYCTHGCAPWTVVGARGHLLLARRVQGLRRGAGKCQGKA